MLDMGLRLARLLAAIQTQQHASVKVTRMRAGPNRVQRWQVEVSYGSNKVAFAAGRVLGRVLARIVKKVETT